MARTRIKSKAVKLCLDKVILDINKQVEHGKDVFGRVVLPEIQKTMKRDNISFREASRLVRKERLSKASQEIIQRDINLLNQ